MEKLETKVMLDTTIIVDYLKKKPDPKAVQIFHEIKAGRLSAPTTSISAFEIYRGARLSSDPPKRLEEARSLLALLGCLPFDETSAQVASELSAILQRKGEPIEVRDLFIGSIAKVAKMPVVTGNTTHFARIPGLEVFTSDTLLKQLER